MFKGKDDLHCNIGKTCSSVFNSNVSYIIFPSEVMVGRLKYRLFMDVFDGHGMAAQTLCFNVLYVQLYGMRNI